MRLGFSIRYQVTNRGDDFPGDDCCFSPNKNLCLLSSLFLTFSVILVANPKSWKGLDAFRFFYKQQLLVRCLNILFRGGIQGVQTEHKMKQFFASSQKSAQEHNK